MTKTYSQTRCGDFRVGDVIRLKADKGYRGPFSDLLILGFDETCNALLARPYAYADHAGTDAPTAEVGCEKVEYLSLENLKLYDVIERDRTVFRG